MPNGHRALVFAAPPPPPGGVAAITALLMRELSPRGDVVFAGPLPKGNHAGLGLRRSLTNLARLVRATLRVRGRSTVLVFASSGFSFWEKCLWSLVVRALGRTVAMVMVDGNFPRFFESLSPPLKSAARLLCSGRAVTLGAQSPSWQHYFNRTFPATRIKVVSASVDREFFAPRVPRPENPPELRVLYVGWVIRAKGVLDLLDAAALLNESSVTGFHLRLVGPLLEYPESWQPEIDRRGLTSVVTLVGSIHDRTRLLREYQSADVFVFPSHFEGFPVALVEAAAVGLPCIGTKVGGIPDILDDGRAGIVVPAHAPTQLAAALRSMVSRPSERDRLGNAIRLHAQQNYTHEACAASYLELLGLSPNGSPIRS